MQKLSSFLILILRLIGTWLLVKIVCSNLTIFGRFRESNCVYIFVRHYSLTNCWLPHCLLNLNEVILSPRNQTKSSQINSIHIISNKSVRIYFITLLELEFSDVETVCIISPRYECHFCQNQLKLNQYQRQPVIIKFHPNPAVLWICGLGLFGCVFTSQRRCMGLFWWVQSHWHRSFIRGRATDHHYTEGSTI